MPHPIDAFLLHFVEKIEMEPFHAANVFRRSGGWCKAVRPQHLSVSKNGHLWRLFQWREG